jgi:DNA invertase Pin-like site-specific DNA recombinase
MSATDVTNGNGKLNLDGPGGAYVRVSGEKQDVERQYADLAAFEDRHGVKVAEAHRYEDHMSRDLSDKRPDFQRMLRAAKTGVIRWVWIQRIDRFGVEDGDELVALRRELRKAGCRLIDSAGTDWTTRDVLTLIRAGLEGERSRSEQVEKSFRSLDGMAKKARAGEWQGGPPKLGFDVACFDRATGAELFRIVWEGRERTKDEQTKKSTYHVRRLKVYPDGRTERFDGNVTFRTSEETQVLRIVPTCDAAKLEAARGLFRRYATEAVTFFDLAKWLNDLRIRNSFGKCFQGRDIEPILSDESYLGFPTFNKNRAGRFHRCANGKIEELPEELKRTYTASNPTDVIRGARPDGGRWFDPLIDRKTWDAVRRKLAGREKAAPSPRSGRLYLSGLLRCAGCGQPMYGRADRAEYFCGTYHKHRCEGTVASSPCLRNAVPHDVLEGFVNRYLQETGERLDKVIDGPTADCLTDKLKGELLLTNTAFWENWLHMLRAIAENDPQGWASLWEGVPEAETAPLEKVIDHYRSCFDPDKMTAEIERLEVEHTSLMRQWADLPTPRAKTKAKAELAALEERIADLERRREDVSETVVTQARQVLDLARSIREARRTMKSADGAHALRQRAEALRGLLVEIRCEFVVTGKGLGKHVGPGQARSRLAAVEFLPIAGDSLRFPASTDSGNSGATEDHSAARCADRVGSRRRGRRRTRPAGRRATGDAIGA